MGAQVFFFGVLSGFRTEAESPIIAVRVLILKEDGIRKRADNPLPQKVTEDVIDPYSWRLLKYYFNGVSTGSDEDCPACLWAPDMFRVLLENNELHYESLGNLVRDIYEGEMRETVLAKEDVSVFEFQRMLTAK